MMHSFTGLDERSVFYGEGTVLTAYFDNSATTRPCESSLQAAAGVLKESWGNPSSLHSVGLDAKKAVDDARKTVADFLGCNADEVFFSPSGTLANNTAILGAVNPKNKALRKIVTSAMEHPSVAKCMESLENAGFEVVRLLPDSSGNINPEEIFNAVDAGTALLSLMAVNNEVGSVLPYEMLRSIVKRKKSPALIHIDAVQAFGKIPLKASYADLITASAHKIHALKGAGLLYKSKNVRLKPYVLGGGQESGLFSGTENVPAISAFAAAIKEAQDIDSNLGYVRALNERLRSNLKKIDGVVFNSPENALPYILNISLSGIRSQVSVNNLSCLGAYVSAGSACSKGHRSDTLVAMGLDAKRIDSAIRISLSRYNTAQEVDFLCECIEKTIGSLK